MKKQIKRFSPHQNGKVFGILMAIASLFMFVPLAMLMAVLGPQVDQYGNQIVFPTGVFVVMPILHAIFGYLAMAIGCALYNWLFHYVGGFEFELIETKA